MLGAPPSGLDSLQLLWRINLTRSPANDKLQLIAVLMVHHFVKVASHKRIVSDALTAVSRAGGRRDSPGMGAGLVHAAAPTSTQSWQYLQA